MILSSSLDSSLFPPLFLFCHVFLVVPQFSNYFFLNNFLFRFLAVIQRCYVKKLKVKKIN